MILLLSVVILVTAGCGSKKKDDVTSIDVTEASLEKTSEIDTIEEVEIEDTEATETDNKKEENAQSVNEDSDNNVPKQTENKTQTTSKDSSNTQNQDSSQEVPQQQNKSDSKETDSNLEPEKSEPKPEHEPEAKPEPEPKTISYSPENVVALATAKTKAAGKILLTENLDKLLANGQITQDEYNEYYPYDGAGYYSVFVDTNMAEARSVSGTTSFHSEDEIAQYIADMLVLENGPYLLIEYAGTYDYYGKQCYEFRCYRA